MLLLSEEVSAVVFLPQGSDHSLKVLERDFK